MTTQNSIQEEIKCRLKAGNLYYYSIQTLLSSRLLSKNLEIKIYKTIILPVVLYDCEALRENLEEIGINAGNWVDSAQDRDYWRALMNLALNLRVS